MNSLDLYECDLNYYVIKIMDNEVRKAFDKYGIKSYIDFMHNHPDNPQARIIYEGGAYYLDELESFYEGLQELNRRK